MIFTGNLRSLNEPSTPSGVTPESDIARRARDLVDGAGRPGQFSSDAVDREMARRRREGVYSGSALGNLPSVRGSRQDEGDQPDESASTIAEAEAAAIAAAIERGRARTKKLLEASFGKGSDKPLVSALAGDVPENAARRRTDDSNEYVGDTVRRENEEWIRTRWQG